MSEHIRCAIAAVSTNTNSFGHTGFILVHGSGRTWEVGASAGSRSHWQQGAYVKVPCDQEGEPQWHRLGVEIPRELPKAPTEVVGRLFL